MQLRSFVTPPAIGLLQRDVILSIAVILLFRPLILSILGVLHMVARCMSIVPWDIPDQKVISLACQMEHGNRRAVALQFRVHHRLHFQAMLLPLGLPSTHPRELLLVR